MLSVSLTLGSPHSGPEGTLGAKNTRSNVIPCRKRLDEHIMKMLELKYLDGDILKKSLFSPFLSLSVFCGLFPSFFGLFGGFSYILWSVEIMGGDHGSIFNFFVLAIFDVFCNFGLFLHFWGLFAFLGGFGRTSEL